MKTEIEIKQRFSGRETFTLPPRQSEQYLRMFPNARTHCGLVICRVPEEYTVSGHVGNIKISGNIVEHPNGYSWFILASKRWHFVKAFSGLAPTVQKAKQLIERLLKAIQQGEQH